MTFRVGNDSSGPVAPSVMDAGSSSPLKPGLAWPLVAPPAYIGLSLPATDH